MNHPERKKLYADRLTWERVTDLSKSTKIPMHSESQPGKGLVDVLLSFAIDFYLSSLDPRITGPYALLNARRERLSHNKDEYITGAELARRIGRPYMTVHNRIRRAIKTGEITDYAIHADGRIYVDPEQGKIALASSPRRPNRATKPNTSKHRTRDAGGDH